MCLLMLGLCLALVDLQVGIFAKLRGALPGGSLVFLGLGRVANLACQVFILGQYRS